MEYCEGGKVDDVSYIRQHKLPVDEVSPNILYMVLTVVHVCVFVCIFHRYRLNLVTYIVR